MWAKAAPDNSENILCVHEHLVHKVNIPPVPPGVGTVPKTNSEIFPVNSYLKCWRNKVVQLGQNLKRSCYTTANRQQLS